MFYQRGRAKYELKKYKEAIKDFDKAITIKDDIPEYYFYRGFAREHIEIYISKSTDEDFDKVIALRQKNLFFYYEMAKSLIITCNHIYINTAIRYLDSADKLNIPNWHFYYKTACFLSSSGQSMNDSLLCDKANEYYDKAIALNPNNWEIYFEAAKALSQSDCRNENIRKYFENAITLNPDNWEIYFEAGKAAAEEEIKIEYFDKVVNFKSNDADLFYEMAKELAGYNKAKAIQYLDNAINIKNDVAEYYFERGSLKLSIDNLYKDSIKDFEKAIDLKPNDSNLYKNIGDVLYDYEKVKKYDIFKKNVAKNIDKINEYYDKAISLNPSNTDLYKEFAIRNYDTKEYKKAISYFNKYLEFNPDDIEIQYEKKFAEILAK